MPVKNLKIVQNLGRYGQKFAAYFFGHPVDKKMYIQ